MSRLDRALYRALLPLAVSLDVSLGRRAALLSAAAPRPAPLSSLLAALRRNDESGAAAAAAVLASPAQSALLGGCGRSQSRLRAGARPSPLWLPPSSGGAPSCLQLLRDAFRLGGGGGGSGGGGGDAGDKA